MSWSMTIKTRSSQPWKKSVSCAIFHPFLFDFPGEKSVAESIRCLADITKLYSNFIAMLQKKRIIWYFLTYKTISSFRK